MYNNIATETIMEIGMKALQEVLDPIETEIFLLNACQSGFDYTEWRRTQPWYDLDPKELFEQLSQNAAEFNKTQN